MSAPSLSSQLGQVRFALHRMQALVSLLDEVNDDSATSSEPGLYDKADALLHVIKLLLSSTISSVDAMEFPLSDLEETSSGTVTP